MLFLFGPKEPTTPVEPSSVSPLAGAQTPDQTPGSISTTTSPGVSPDHSRIEIPGDATDNPDVRLVRGVRMLRGKRVTGEEIWIPEDPATQNASRKEPEETEFLPAPSER